MIAIPDADQTPEAICGLTEGVPPASQFARRLAESGCRVLVPTLISRELQARLGRATLTNREYLYRSAFELGRHLIGYEVQKVLAGVDWFVKDAGAGGAKIGVMGWGEGGLLALYAGALDPRIDAVCVSGYFDSRQNVWQEPIDRNVFGLLEQFGDAELASPDRAAAADCRGVPGAGVGIARQRRRAGTAGDAEPGDVQAEVARAKELARTGDRPGRGRRRHRPVRLRRRR